MGKRILVIDDEEAIRKSFLLSLEDTDYIVDTAESGKIGIEKRKCHPYHLIFLDLKMPGLSGTETLRELRKIDGKSPIYIVTAFYGEYFEELEAAQKDGIHFEVLKKPISGKDIVLIAKSIFEGPIGICN